MAQSVEFIQKKGSVNRLSWSRSSLVLSGKVCQIFCVNDEVLFLGWVREGRGSIPSLAQRCRRILCFHDATLSRAGIRSGHRTVKWFKASRQ